MPKLPAEAYAIIEGRHSDPFHYLGLHPEGGKSVVRAFLPEAADVEAVGEHGEVARLDRVHDAGLFIGALPNGSKHYQLRAKFGQRRTRRPAHQASKPLRRFTLDVLINKLLLGLREHLHR